MTLKIGAMVATVMVILAMDSQKKVWTSRQLFGALEYELFFYNEWTKLESLLIMALFWWDETKDVRKVDKRCCETVFNSRVPNLLTSKPCLRYPYWTPGLARPTCRTTRGKDKTNATRPLTSQIYYDL